MLTKHQRKWIEALRSGNYVQGHGYLQYHEEGYNRYCCLGVACEVLGEEVGLTHHQDSEGITFFYDVKAGDENEACFTGSMVELLKLRGKEGEGDISPEVTPAELVQYCANEADRAAVASGDNPFSCLTAMNDHGLSFETIANFIEANPERVFLSGGQSYES